MQQTTMSSPTPSLQDSEDDDNHHHPRVSLHNPHKEASSTAISESDMPCASFDTPTTKQDVVVHAKSGETTPMMPNARLVASSRTTRSNSLPAEEVTLEDRVVDLELKLATLSRLLQQQRLDSGSPMLMPRSVSPHGGGGGGAAAGLLMSSVEENTASIPYLESPCPSRRESSGVLMELGMTGTENDDEHNRTVAIPEDGEGASLPAHPFKGTMVRSRNDVLTTRKMDDRLGSTKPVVTYHADSSQKAMDEGSPDRRESAFFFTPLRDFTQVPGASSIKPTSNRRPAAAAPPPPPPPPLESSSTSPPDKHHHQQQQQESSSSVQQKWLNYLNTFQESTPDVDIQMEEFIKVPSKVEWLLGFGWMICVDCFLYVLTILVIRFVWSCVLLIVWIWRRIKGTLKGQRTNDAEGKQPNRHYVFHRRHVYQLIQVGIIYTVYRTLLVPISIGKLYHWIRGQAMLKLYVLIAIVEVFDRLFCSLGQDCLDSMYWNTTRRPKSSRMYISIVVVLCYAACHTLILFVHVATLNVAMNSADQALLALLISGNFAEIKSTVFKKYNKKNLFKITASDICERFKLALFLSLVLVLNWSQGMDRRQLVEYVEMCCVVWFGEVAADWVKHSFITKFNFIPSSVYPEYALLLAGDVTGIGHEHINLDNSHAVVKRVGLAQIPLVCVLLRYLSEAARYTLPQFHRTPPWVVAATVLGIWCLLLTLKITLGAYLQTLSRAKLYAAPELVGFPQPTPAKKKRE